jgi:hypothetical protein
LVVESNASINPDTMGIIIAAAEVLTFQHERKNVMRRIPKKILMIFMDSLWTHIKQNTNLSKIWLQNSHSIRFSMFINCAF